jgi:hypothetical protein
MPSLMLLPVADSRRQFLTLKAIFSQFLTIQRDCPYKDFLAKLYICE